MRHGSDLDRVAERRNLRAIATASEFRFRLELDSIALCLAVGLPDVVSVPLKRLPIALRSFSYPQPANNAAKPQSGGHALHDDALVLPAAPCSLLPAPRSPSRPATRLKPPGDIIKLEDRLLLSSCSRRWKRCSPIRRSIFPSCRFHFNSKAWRFCIRGMAAILADEMGLGKTMQAITAIRLLLHAGELRSVLLVCPKPLVTNWQREFAALGAGIAADRDRGRSGETPLAMAA